MNPLIGTLWVVATPIGNRSDLSTRMQEVIEEVSYVLCEDTRRVRQLFPSLSSKKLYRFDAYAEKKKTSKWIEVLEKGEDIALVSDAGTPVVQDPGMFLLQQVHQHHISVRIIPGPSAVTAIYALSALGGGKFCFRGFFPKKKNAQKEELSWVEQEGKQLGAVIWFESPKRVLQTVSVLAQWFPNQLFALAKELSKIHETLWWGSTKEVLLNLTESCSKNPQLLKGEWAFVLEAPRKKKVFQEDWKKLLTALAQKHPPRKWAHTVAQFFHVSTSEVYNFWQKEIHKQNLNRSDSN